MTAPVTMMPWRVIRSPGCLEMWAVAGAYIVADNLPHEDACMIAAAPRAIEALKEALTLMRGDPDMSLPGSDHWLWAESANAAIAFTEGEGV